MSKLPPRPQGYGTKGERSKVAADAFVRIAHEALETAVTQEREAILALLRRSMARHDAMHILAMKEGTSWASATLREIIEEVEAGKHREGT